jgi:hypothetical protein
MQTTNAASVNTVASVVTVEPRMSRIGAAVQKEPRSRTMATAEMAAATGLRTSAPVKLSGRASVSGHPNGFGQLLEA